MVMFEQDPARSYPKKRKEMAMKNNGIRILSFTFLLVFILVGEVFAGSATIAVAADGGKQDSNISQQAARASWFLFFDEQGVFLEATQNPAKDLKGGAGGSAAEFLDKRGVKIVTAASFGDKMAAALDGYHIKYIEKEGVADIVVREILKEQ